jgi:hypothetical protein
MIKPKSTRQYQVHVLPPRVYWQVPVTLTRADAVTVCEELHYSVSELGGAIFSYPEDAKNAVTCRFEFHEKLGARRTELRLGLQITIGPRDVTEIQAYMYAADANGAARQQTNFPETVIQRARARIAAAATMGLRSRIMSVLDFSTVMSKPAAADVN